MAGSRRDLWWVVLLALGLVNVGNGIWMLLDAFGWFARIAPDVSPLNAHFVRDIGAAYLATGVALAWAAFRPAWRVPLVAPAALFHGLHALGHVRETSSGELASFHWLADLPTIYLPALLMLGMVWIFARRPAPTAERS